MEDTAWIRITFASPHGHMLPSLDLFFSFSSLLFSYLLSFPSPLTRPPCISAPFDIAFTLWIVFLLNCFPYFLKLPSPPLRQWLSSYPPILFDDYWAACWVLQGALLEAAPSRGPHVPRALQQPTFIDNRFLFHLIVFDISHVFCVKTYPEPYFVFCKFQLHLLKKGEWRQRWNLRESRGQLFHPASFFFIFSY